MFGIGSIFVDVLKLKNERQNTYDLKVSLAVLFDCE